MGQGGGMGELQAIYLESVNIHFVLMRVRERALRYAENCLTLKI